MKKRSSPKIVYEMMLYKFIVNEYVLTEAINVYSLTELFKKLVDYNMLNFQSVQYVYNQLEMIGRISVFGISDIQEQQRIDISKY
jgi:hypothetical protein